MKTAKKRPAGITEVDVMDTDASEEEECREPVDIKPDPVRTVAATTLTDPDNRSRDIKLTSVPVVLADTTSPVSVFVGWHKYSFIWPLSAFVTP